MPSGIDAGSKTYFNLGNRHDFKTTRRIVAFWNRFHVEPPTGCRGGTVFLSRSK